MGSYLFLFTLGPVQSFISQARKTQDLYAGSLILSDLIDLSIKKMKDLEVVVKDGIVFPFEGLPSKPNRFIAIIKTNNPQKTGELIENALRVEFENLCQKYCNKRYRIDSIGNQFKQQVNNLLNIYWLALHYDGNYLDSFINIEKFHGGIKNIRYFNQMPETGRKCALCGERNVLYYKPLKTNDTKSNIGPHITIKRDDYSFIPGEGLCAICTLKRFYKDEETASFPSTARISLLEALHRLNRKNGGYVYLDNYRKLFSNSKEDAKECHFDEQLYYEENINEHYFRKHNLEGLLDRLSAIKEGNKKIRDYANTEKIKLNKYYAMIAFDGDNMGKWLSGEKLKDKEKNLENFHRQLSKLLGEYANFAREHLKSPEDTRLDQIRDAYLGRAVYAGGDDFLGLVNINHLFQVLKSLRDQFNTMVNQPVKQQFELENSDDNLTFSAGISIAHYKIPLSIALEWTRRMQKRAKKVEDKDAVGFALLKHSGNIADAILKFDWIYKNYNDDLNNKIDVSFELIKALNTLISNKFLFTLREEFLHLIEPGKRIILIAEEIQSEFWRLINRHKKIEKAENTNTTEDMNQLNLNNLASELKTLILEMDNLFEHNAFNNFINFLEICNFVSKER